MGGQLGIVMNPFLYGTNGFSASPRGLLPLTLEQRPCDINAEVGMATTPRSAQILPFI